MQYQDKNVNEILQKNAVFLKKKWNKIKNKKRQGRGVWKGDWWALFWGVRHAAWFTHSLTHSGNHALCVFSSLSSVGSVGMWGMFWDFVASHSERSQCKEWLQQCDHSEYFPKPYSIIGKEECCYACLEKRQFGASTD